MKSFLNQVSEYIYKTYHEEFRELQLVFPNQRSIAYFNNELGKVVDRDLWLPKTQTIAEFMEEASSLQKGSQVALLFKLYKVYVKLTGSKELFDDFFHWGEILLNDFDDVDKYLADPRAVFLNVKDYKEIDKKIDFLTVEQQEVLKTFFKSFDSQKYSDLQKNFLEIWQILLPLYQQYNNVLLSENMAYEGAVYRNALERIKADGLVGAKRIVFVGFNAITKCEEQIFKTLRDRDQAVFFWDFDNFYMNDFQQEAGMFVRKYLKMFPHPEDFSLSSDIASGSCQISVVSAPTNYGQIELVGEALSAVDVKDLNNTAVVLADESLLFSTINNLPSNVATINTTMGYPVLESKVGGLVELLILLQQNSRVNSSGELVFYYKHVLRVLRHSLVMRFDDDESLGLIEEIVTGNMFEVATVAKSEVALFKLLFVKRDNLYEYLNSILVHFMHRLIALDEGGESSLDMEFLFAAIKSNNQLNDELNSSEIVLKGETYSGLLLKVLKNQKVPFEGEPLKGLQLMGFLETRNLDFEQVFVVSVNEGLLPANQRKSSFVPYSLRRGFGLPTTEMHDAMYAYYFYRLLQRSAKVHLIYNSGSSGMQSGEKSRLIQQLVFHEKFNITETNLEQGVELLLKDSQRVVKDERVMAVLEEFFESDSSRKLSPSALSRYLQCQLRFYYYSVLRIYESDEIEEKVDARLFGNLFHHAMEYLYKEAFESKTLLDKQYFDKLSSANYIDRAVQLAFNEVFRAKRGRDFVVKGKNELVRAVLLEYIKQLLVNDNKVAPISIVGLEQSLFSSIEFEVNGEECKVLVGGLVDRIDRTDSALRIIDYKTGGDKLVFKTLDDVFNPVKISDHKAVLQTFIYSLIYSLNYPEERVVEPLVYQVKEFYVPSADFKIKSKVELDYVSGNFKGIQGGVHERLKGLMSEIFNPKIPFEETEDEKQCVYCAYKVLCGK